MQNCYKLIFFFAALTLANFVKGQTTFLCSGEQVTLEAGANYWGTPQWEFTSDGVTWNAVSDQATFSFTLNAGNSGLYRLSYTADDCSYFSETKEIRALADSFAIRNFFTNHQIPDEADPVFWYESQNSLTQITYFLNGIEVASTDSLLQMIQNPGSNFEIYATAINQSGCSVYTPIYSYTVYNSAQTGNGDLQITGNFNIQEVLISSSIDSLNAVVNGDFEIDYSYSMGFDVIFASRPLLPAEQQLVGLCVLYDENESFVLNSESTALSMVLMLQDVTNIARIYPDIVKNYIQQNSQFVVAVNEIAEQLNTNGFIDIQDENLWQIIRTIGVDVVNNLFPTFFDACLVPDAPNIQINGDHLKFENCGINTAYFARLYNNENQPVSDPILFLGDGQTMFGNDAFNFIGNLLISNPSTAALFEAYQTRVSDKIFPGDITNYTPFDELRVRLTNGKGLNTQLEDGAAEAYNDFTFIWSFTASLLGHPAVAKGMLVTLGQAGECGVSTIQLIVQSYNEIVKPTNYTNIGDLALTLAQFTSSISSVVESCPSSIWSGIKGKFTRTCALLGFWYEAGWMVQHLNDLHTKIPKVKYTCTIAGNHWMGKLKFVSNANQPFYGVPGSLAYNDSNEKPYFKIEETAVYATTDNGSVLSEYEYLPLTNLEGFTCSGNSYNTQELAFSHVPNQSLGTFLSDVEFDTIPIDLLWHFKRNAIAPNVASFNIKFKYSGEWIPLYIDGLQNLFYEGIIETPQLSIMSGSNNQTVAANSFLPYYCIVELEGSSGRPARDCDVAFEVIEGGGTLQNYAPWPNSGETPIKIINTIYDTPNYFDGSAGVNWRLGQSGDQKLKVSYKPNGVALTSVQLDATIGSCDGTLQISLNQSGASLSATASGGQSPYTFKFANSSFSSSQNYTVSFDGKYQVIVQDFNSCTDTAYISVCDVQLTNVAIVSDTNFYYLEISYQSPLGLNPEFIGPYNMPDLLVESTNYSSWSLNLNNYCDGGGNSFPYLNPAFISTTGDQYNKTIRYYIPGSSTTGTITRMASIRLPGQCFSDWNCLGNPEIKASQLYTLQWLWE